MSSPLIQAPTSDSAYSWGGGEQKLGKNREQEANKDLSTEQSVNHRHKDKREKSTEIWAGQRQGKVPKSLAREAPGAVPAGEIHQRGVYRADTTRRRGDSGCQRKFCITQEDHDLKKRGPRNMEVRGKTRTRTGHRKKQLRKRGGIKTVRQETEPRK